MAAAAVTCPREAESESDGRGPGPVDSEAADAAAASVPRSSMSSPSPSTVACDEPLLQNGAGAVADEDEEEEGSLPQCKIKRNYTCSHCNYFTQNPRNFLYHLRGVHKEKLRIYECPSCLYASKHSQKLQRHVHMVHVMGKGRKKAANPKPPKPPKPKKEPSPAPEDFPWDVKEEEEDEEGDEEEESVTEARCSQCPFTDKSKALVARHEQAAHLRKKFYRCAKCNYMTHLRARYTKHVKYHSMPMIKCAMCDFRTPYKWNLDRHYKNHTGDGAFRCSLCNFTADIKQSLTVHEMNHHVPPAAGLAPLPRRRNKVGASDCDAQLDVDVEADDVQCKIPNYKPNLETPPGLPSSVLQPTTVSDNSNSDGAFVPLLKKSPKIKITPRKIKVPSTQEQNERHNFETDFIHPDDIIHHKNGNVYIKNLKCKKCNFKSAWEGEMARHETKVHGMSRSLIKPPLKKIPRPIPNLIPIQNKLPVTTPPSNLPILKIPTIRSRVNVNSGCSLLKPQVPQSPETCLSEKDLNEICAKSCPNSSLRDFASLIGDENAFKILDDDKSLIQKQELNTIQNCSVDPPDPYFESKCDISTSTLKKKNASFFDQLKEKLLVGTGDPSNLVCSCCGHESKCLSESLRHEKLHTSEPVSDKGALPVSTCTQSIPSGAELSSTRCQRCRQRCKTSADLVVHLQTCVERSKSPSHNEISSDVKIEMGSQENNDEESKGNDSHPMVNKVFVWNDIQPSLESEAELNESNVNGESYSTSELSISIAQDDMDESEHSNSPNSESSLVGVETAPGYGAVMGTPDAEGQSQEMEANISNITTNNGALAVKKVFKCPHCSFWASTASRFHVHIVGHLNKKPFECSLCAYRSNWRWDITKHIKLKSIRDENHEKAKVLMTDETGRRNYSKYNKYLTVMRVQEPLNIQSQQVLPAPPQLTRAPDRPTGNQEPQSVSGTLRPPPPLRAAHHIVFPGPPTVHQPENVNFKKTMKRPARILFDDEDQPPSKKPVTETKKTLWKCKKCNFRDASRAQVLAHVKEHYQQRLLIQPEGTSEASVERGSAPFKCGHCHQVSNWKHVIQRHCRLKHSGDVRVVTDSKEEDHDEKSSGEDNELDANETQTEDNLNSCTMCPFVANTDTDMREHLQHHSPHPDAIFKCFSCPYFVFHKSDLLEHMKLHGVNETDDSVEAIQEKMSAQMHLLADHDKNMKSQQAMGNDGSPNKRYKCVNCPYVSNSKSQFLYHKQFHRPRGAPFKCGLCSYNVSRRHLLHQHLRVHGILIPPQKSPSKCGKENVEGVEDVEEISPDQSSQVQAPIDTHHLPHIPLVWVSRSSKFFKMYKCRFCPHVNMRKANIQEHEKMHQARNKVITTQEADGSIKTKEHTQTQHRCPDCNYVCNNAGVLSSHAKVHQGVYGTVYALVDSSRSDESQLQELTASLKLPVESPQVADESNISFISESDPEIAVEVNLNNSATSKDTSNVETDIPSTVTNTGNSADNIDEPHILHFCSHCPARFMVEKEIKIHSRFHELNLAHQCESCTYTSRQRPYLLAHQKVHTSDYQEKTNTLCNIYQVSSQYPRPRTALIVEGPGVSGSVWIVVDAQKHSIQLNKKKLHSGPKQVEKHYSCALCPAKFIKSVALQYHISLHGGEGMYKCKYCDYAVKTYGNLVKHEMIHENVSSQKLDNVLSSPERNVKDKLLSENIPLSGTDLFQHKSEASKLMTEDKMNNIKDNQNLHVDPQFGILMHGSPEFIYPTYLKNGRMKEKRYKCHKCPSAFEKREQYKTHLSLHGAKQRYKCEKCDYSVKYYANYIQHMRKHKNNDEAQAARKLEIPQESDSVSHFVPEEKEEETENEIPANDIKEPSIQHSVKSIGNSPKKPGPIQMSIADRQMLMLMQLKHSDEPLPKTETFEEQLKQKCRCPHCPYFNNQPDALDNHVKQHISVSGIQSNFVCNFCDYSVAQLHLLREHNKLHFSTQIRFTPECYMKCKEIKIWTHPDDKENTLTTSNKIQVFSTKKISNMESKNILFQDKGKKLTEFDRFYPSLLPKNIIDSGHKEKIFIDIDTSEPLDTNYSDDANVHDEDIQNKSEPVCTELISSQGTEEINEQEEEETNNVSYNGEDEEESVDCLVKEKLIGEHDTNFVEKQKFTDNSEYPEQDTYLNDNSNRSDTSAVSDNDIYDFTNHDNSKQPNSAVIADKYDHHYSETKTDRTSESD